MENLISFIKNHQGKIFLSLIIFLIIILRFVPISSGDMYSDNAINSFRAYGWFDSLGDSGQSTPFVWLGYIPFWGILSFHDAPPIAFLIQYIFFGILGDSVVVARLPFVLAGIASIFLVYKFLKKILNSNTACLAALVYAVSSYNVYAGQAAFLEGIEEFFIVASVLFGGYFLIKEQKPKFLYGWLPLAILAVLTKYTAIFLIPPILIYAYIYRKDIRQKWKHAILSLIICIVLLSPVIIYNAEVYNLRGHFDAALSSMVGMHPDDYSIISGRTLSMDIGYNIKGFFLTLMRNMSYPMFALFIACLLFLLWNIQKSGLRSFESWILMNLLFMILLFGFAGAAVRFLTIAVPFLVIVIALGISRINQTLNSENYKYIFGIIIGLIISFEFIYAFNNNVLKESIGQVGWFHSSNKVLNLGFNKLDYFIRQTAIPNLPKRNIIRTKNDTVFGNSDIEGRSVVVFDDRILWFAQMWYFQKYFLYYRWPVISTSFLATSTNNGITLEALMNVSGKPLYFIYPINETVMDSVREANNKINYIGPELAKKFDSSVATMTIIRNENGIPVFKVYQVDKL
jgi:4-amino-4-deoxy-L-arabinose transferase-like glycosyltransferase